jgi:dihydroorotate dehydrogenase
LGFELEAPFGVSAGIATSGLAQIRFLARTGVGIITTKSFLSRRRPPLDPPHILRVHTSSDLRPEYLLRSSPTPEVLFQRHCEQPLSAGISSHFGLPSPDPAVWAQDVKSAQSVLGPNQLLVVSIAGLPKHVGDRASLVADFERAASIAVSEGGAKALEVNVSCPGLGEIFSDIALMREICKSVRACARNCKLVLKIGLASRSIIETILLTVGPLVDAISATNSLPVKPMRLSQEGERLEAGYPSATALSGEPLLPLGLEYVREISRLCQKHGSLAHLQISGVGGVRRPEDVFRYFEAGATVVQAHTVFLDDSYFGIKVRRRLDAQLHTSALSFDGERETAYKNWAKALRELPVSESNRRAMLTEAAVVIDEWVRRHDAGRAAVARNPAALPTVDFFKREILARIMGK